MPGGRTLGDRMPGGPEVPGRGGRTMRRNRPTVAPGARGCSGDGRRAAGRPEAGPFSPDPAGQGQHPRQSPAAAADRRGLPGGRRCRDTAGRAGTTPPAGTPAGVRPSGGPQRAAPTRPGRNGRRGRDGCGIPYLTSSCSRCVAKLFHRVIRSLVRHRYPSLALADGRWLMRRCDRSRASAVGGRKPHRPHQRRRTDATVRSQSGP